MGDGARWGTGVTVGVRGFDPAAMARLRRARGLSLDALAERVGATRPQLIGWEKGRVAPLARSLRLLADALGVDPWELMSSTRTTATLADLRCNAGYTQSEIAGLIGMPHASYSAVERGVLALHSDAAERLASVLGCAPGDVQRAHRRTRRPPDGDPGSGRRGPGAGQRAKKRASQSPVVPRKRGR